MARLEGKSLCPHVQQATQKNRTLGLGRLPTSPGGFGRCARPPREHSRVFQPGIRAYSLNSVYSALIGRIGSINISPRKGVFKCSVGVKRYTVFNNGRNLSKCQRTTVLRQIVYRRLCFKTCEVGGG
jgi:hypothetical protein